LKGAEVLRRGEMLNENPWGGLSSKLLDQSKQGASSFQQSSKEIRKTWMFGDIYHLVQV